MSIQKKQSTPKPVQYSGGGPNHPHEFTGNPHSKQNQSQQKEQEQKSWLGQAADTAKSLALKTAIAGGFYTLLNNYVNMAKLADPGTLDVIANNFGNLDAWSSVDGFGNAVSSVSNNFVDTGVVDNGDLIGHLSDGAEVGADFGYVAFAMIGAFAAWKAAGAALSAGSSLWDGAKAVAGKLDDAWEGLKEKVSGKKEEPEAEMSNTPTPSPGRP